MYSGREQKRHIAIDIASAIIACRTRTGYEKIELCTHVAEFWEVRPQTVISYVNENIECTYIKSGEIHHLSGLGIVNCLAGQQRTREETFTLRISDWLAAIHMPIDQQAMLEAKLRSISKNFRLVESRVPPYSPTPTES